MARIVTVIVVGSVAVGLAACAPSPVSDDNPAPISPTMPTSRPSETAPPGSEPMLVEDGTAQENQEYFDSVIAALTTDGNPGGRAIVDGLVRAGFDKKAMQVTHDRTPLGNRVDALQFSIELKESCLVGQLDGQGYTSTATSPLNNGGCLVGATRTIDW